MKQRIEKFTLKAIQQYHHATLIQFDDQETLVEAIANRIGFSGANPVAFLSILARRPEIRISDLNEALLNDRSLVRANAFRSSLGLFASVDYPIYFRALNQLLESTNMAKLDSMGISPSELARIRYRLEESNFTISKPREEITDTMFARHQTKPNINIQRLIIRKLCEQGVLIRTYSKGFKGNEFHYALAKHWFPDFKLGSEGQEAARVQLIRRYLNSYGPASALDIQWWTGLAEAQVKRALTNLRREITKVHIENHKEDLFHLKERLNALKKPPYPIQNILFLPPFDPFTSGWLNRKRTVRKCDFPFVYDKVGNACGSIVLLGKIIGIWQFREAGDHIFEFQLFEKDPTILREVRYLAEQFAGTVAKISGSLSVQLYERPLPKPLNKREAGAFLWPLGKEPLFKLPANSINKNPFDRRSPSTFRSSYLNDLSPLIHLE